MLEEAGNFWRKLRKRRRQRRGYKSEEEIVVQLYRGYRSTEKLYVEGRVLEDEGIEVSEDDRLWRNMVNAIRRFESDEVAGARVRVTYLGQSYELVADPEGYIKLYEEVTVQPTDEPWEGIEATLLELPFGNHSEEPFAGEVADLSQEATYAVVTDIDDTLLKTHITSLFKLKALYHTVVDNSYTRMAFPGAPELYQQLYNGPGPEQENNPVFYLSRSPWNLYDMLEHFLDIKGFPKGPIFLRDVGLPYKNTPSEYGHKEGTLLRLIRDFPTLKFICIGDSGEKDADIYSAVAAKHPDRIAAVIIRNVKNNKNARRIARMFARKRPEDHFYLVKDSVEAAARLRQLGHLTEAQVDLVSESIGRDAPTAAHA